MVTHSWDLFWLACFGWLLCCAAVGWTPSGKPVRQHAASDVAAHKSRFGPTPQWKVVVFNQAVFDCVSLFLIPLLDVSCSACVGASFWILADFRLLSAVRLPRSFC